MPRFVSDFRETFTTSASAEVAHRAFGDLDVLIANYGDLERADKHDERTVEYLLKEANHGVTTFQGHYTCRYDYTDDHTVTWTTTSEGSNIVASGTARFTATPNGASIDYDARIELEMDIPRLMAPMLKPVISQVAAHEMKQFVKRMIRAAEAL